MWLGPPLPLAVASEHLSGRPQRVREQRQGEGERAGEGGRGAEPGCARVAPPSERRFSSKLPGPARAPPLPPSCSRLPPPHPPPHSAPRRAPSHAPGPTRRAPGPGGVGGASSPERRLQGSWRRSPLFCGGCPRWAAGRVGGVGLVAADGLPLSRTSDF
jgi:hypothetical protein